MQLGTAPSTGVFLVSQRKSLCCCDRAPPAVGGCRGRGGKGPGVWGPAELLLPGKLERVLPLVPWVGPQLSLWQGCSQARPPGLGGLSPSPASLGGFCTLGRNRHPKCERLWDFLCKKPVLGCALPLSPCPQAFKGKRDSMPPHICSVAQRAYRNLLLQRQDQAIVPLGRSGAGKTTCCQSALEYLAGTAGSVDGRVSGTGPGGRCELRALAAAAGGLRGAWCWAGAAHGDCLRRLGGALEREGDALSI